MDRTVIGSESVKHVEHASFGILDERGRTIGALIVTGEREFVTAPADAMSFYDQPAGRFFYSTVHATRDGKPFGAMQHPLYFRSEEARSAHIKNYLKTARIRAARKVAARTGA
jgi:hypothetical protein